MEMDIMEISEHRKQLFEVIDSKIENMYLATRSRKNVEEVREYVAVLLFLCREYLEIHRHHFLLHRKYSGRWLYNPIESFIETTSIRTLLPNRTWEEEWISLEDIHAIRRYFTWLFQKILEIHSFFERANYAVEEGRRYTWIHGNKYLKPRRWWGGRASGGTSFGTKLDAWSGTFRAKNTYDCDKCPHQIERGETYEKEVIRLWESVEILRYHIVCPDDPNDPREREESEDIEWETEILLLAA